MLVRRVSDLKEDADEQMNSIQDWKRPATQGPAQWLRKKWQHG